MGVSGGSSIFSSPSTGTIKDSPYPATVFMTVTGAGPEAGNTIIFDLTQLVTNTGATVGNCASNAALNSCTPASSPFTFSMDITGTQLTIQFTALLNAYTGTSATGTTAYRAVFSTTQSGNVFGAGPCAGVPANITSLLACEAAGRTVRPTWSATAAPAPPSVTCTANPTTLWPPNGKAVVVTVSGEVTPGAEAIAANGTTYAVVDEYGQDQPSGSFTPGAGGHYSFGVPLIAARNGDDPDGRTYTIDVIVKDVKGNSGSCSAVVTVPHDQGH
jgi:hypothetical protein